MMIRKKPIVLVLTLSAITGLTLPRTVGTEETTLPSLSVLFVDNSYCDFHVIPGQVAGMLSHAGQPAICKRKTEGGFDWMKHWDAETALDRIKNRVFYATIAGKSPLDQMHSIDGYNWVTKGEKLVDIEPVLAETIQRVAWETVESFDPAHYASNDHPVPVNAAVEIPRTAATPPRPGVAFNASAMQINFGGKKDVPGWTRAGGAVAAPVALVDTLENPTGSVGRRMNRVRLSYRLCWMNLAEFLRASALGPSRPRATQAVQLLCLGSEANGTYLGLNGDGSPLPITYARR